MIIKFSCDQISDMTKLYRISDSEAIDSGLSYGGIGYCTSLLADVKDSVSSLTLLSYKGVKVRKANEMFVVHGKGLYEITFRIDTFNKHTKTHLEVTIESVGDDEYNIELEFLKRNLKNRLLKDWQICTWLQDDQSELLCTKLYSDIFHLEGTLRSFVSKAMIYNFGTAWLHRLGMEKYLHSITVMKNEFKQKVPDFENINTDFLSMTLETLKEIMFHGVVFKEPVCLNSEEYERLCNIIHKGTKENAEQYLSERRSIDKVLWKDIFSNYFTCPEKFEPAIYAFIKNRNHIAHNKIITFSVYKTIKKEFKELETLLNNAIVEFENENVSSELEDTWMDETVKESEFIDFKTGYLRNKIKEELNINVLNQDTIYGSFCDTIYDFYENIYDCYHYDEKFSVSNYINPDLQNESDIFTVTSNAAPESKIQIIVSMDINDEFDADSFMKVNCVKNTKVLFSTCITHHNGSGYEDEGGVLKAGSETFYDDSKLKVFKEELVDYINNELNPYIAELASLEHIAGKEGAPSPVAYFPCENCGQSGISVMDSFFPVGKCCFCGYQNKVKICYRCGEFYAIDDGDDYLCSACLSDIDKE